MKKIVVFFVTKLLIISSNKGFNNTNRIVFLDYLRIFAFSSVLIGHKFYNHLTEFVNNQEIHVVPKFIVNLLLPLFVAGGAGVIVFFLVSGYIITHVLQTEETTSFIIRRVFRVYPLYIVAVLIQTLISLINTGSYPNLLIVFQQLLLVGDFFETPYSLNGVEWTLRIEVIFYVFMAIFRYLNILHDGKKTYLALLLITIVLYWFSPIPSYNIWSKGYVSAHMPFLFLGVAFYLVEKKQINIVLFLIFVSLVFYQYFNFIAIFLKQYIDTPFALFSFLIFAILWFSKDYLKSSALILFLSDLTYAVYLFHNWLFEVFDKIIYDVFLIKSECLALFLLLLFCWLMVKSIEKPSIQIGRRVQKRFMVWRSSC